MLVDKASYYGKRFVHEILEALMVLVIVKVVTKQKFLSTSDSLQILKLSIFIGSLTLILEEISPELKSSIKQGMNYTIGSAILKQVI